MLHAEAGTDGWAVFPDTLSIGHTGVVDHEGYRYEAPGTETTQVETSEKEESFRFYLSDFFYQSCSASLLASISVQLSSGG